MDGENNGENPMNKWMIWGETSKYQDIWMFLPETNISRGVPCDLSSPGAQDELLQRLRHLKVQTWERMVRAPKVVGGSIQRWKFSFHFFFGGEGWWHGCLLFSCLFWVAKYSKYSWFFLCSTYISCELVNNFLSSFLFLGSRCIWLR